MSNRKLDKSLNNTNLIEIKSKFDAEFRRFSLDKSELSKFEDFSKLVEHFHKLFSVSFSIFYSDPIHGDLLPINNDDNFLKAIQSAKPLLRLIIQRKGESWEHLNGLAANKKKNFLGLSNILPLPSSSSPNKNKLSIGLPEDFRQVSSIIDVDIVPETCRRVRLVKHGSDKPLGFYIRDGTSVRVTPHGLEKVAGIFISRLVPGGLAESTGLLAVNDEVLEVNGIEVLGKSLDQVTDMMVANSSNLIITIRPANQRNVPMSAMRGSYCRSSQLSQDSSHNSALSASDDEEDEIRDYGLNSQTVNANSTNTTNASNTSNTMVNNANTNTNTNNNNNNTSTNSKSDIITDNDIVTL